MDSRSSRDMPMPLSDTVSVPASLSAFTRICRTGSSFVSSGFVSARKRSLSIASKRSRRARAGTLPCWSTRTLRAKSEAWRLRFENHGLQQPFSLSPVKSKVHEFVAKTASETRFALLGIWGLLPFFSSPQTAKNPDQQLPSRV